ncbi:MAG TPA: hypothetical protein VMU75_01670 [Acidimicrobiales bacterium]|nr:hypothetical protein [Acidimicrobiales bacterium]
MTTIVLVHGDGGTVVLGHGAQRREWATSHTPFFSSPEPVMDLVAGLAAPDTTCRRPKR